MSSKWFRIIVVSELALGIFLLGVCVGMIASR